MSRQHRVARVACLTLGTLRDRARVEACTASGSAEFLTAVPTENELSLCNLDMQLAVRLRLGMKSAGDRVWCRRCQRQVDSDCDHAHCCRGNSTIRHNRLRDLFYTLLQRAGFDALTEQEEPSLRHRPDLRVSHGLAPTPPYLDVSVTHAIAPSANLRRNAEGPDAATRAAWDDKFAREYAPLPPRMAFRLLPAVCTSYGGWHPATRRFLQECAARVAAANAALPCSDTLARGVLQGWVTRLSVGVQRENAAMVRRCVGADGAFGLDTHWSEGPSLLWEQTCMSCACEDLGGGSDDDDDAASLLEAASVADRARQ